MRGIVRKLSVANPVMANDRGMTNERTCGISADHDELLVACIGFDDLTILKK